MENKRENMAIRIKGLLSPRSRFDLPASSRLPARNFQRIVGPDPQIIEECFRRSKATSNQYGLGGKIKYGLILPFKKLVLGLSGYQQAKLDLYHNHIALCTGVQKVKKAYHDYRKAEKAADKAIDLTLARSQEHAQADAFVNAYNALIALAVAQAASCHISRNVYLQDLHAVLALQGDGLIFRTVNQARAKLDLENGMLGPKITEEKYQAFVSSFPHHVRQAAKDAGSTRQDTIQAITEAFIEGLASFPELGSSVMPQIRNLQKLRDPRLIGDPAERHQVEMDKDQLQAALVKNFGEQLEKLLNNDQPITKEALDQIQHQGISLFSVRRPYAEKEILQLQALQQLRADLQATKKEIAEKVELQSDQQAILDQKTEITIDEINAFLLANGKRLESDANIDALQAQLSKYHEAMQALAEIDQNIQGMPAHFAREKADFTRQITAQKQIVHQIECLKIKLKEKMHIVLPLIQSIDKGLEAFENEYRLAKKELNSLSEKEKHELQIALGRDYIQKGEKDYSAKKQRVEEDRKGLLDRLQSYQTKFAETEKELNEAQTSLEKMEEVDYEAERVYKQAIKQLAAERKTLTETPIEFSGEDLKVLGQFLGMNPAQLQNDTPMGQKVVEAILAFNKNLALGKEVDSLTARAEEIQAEISTNLPPLFKFNPVSGEFTCARFWGDEQPQIESKLNTRLAISQEIHTRVGDALVRNHQLEIQNNLEVVQRAKGRMALTHHETVLERDLRDTARMRDIDLYPKISSLVDPFTRQPDPIRMADLALLIDDEPMFSSDESDTEEFPETI